MNTSLRIRVAIALVSILFSSIIVLSNIPSFQDSFLGEIVGDKGVKLGLDLQGGVHLLLEVDVEKAIVASLNQAITDIRSILREDSIILLRPRFIEKNARITLLQKDKKNLFVSYLNREYPHIIILNEKEVSQNIEYTLSYTTTYQEEVSKLAQEQAVQTIRNRIDQFGVSEPDIRAQEGYRIQVQLPGLQDTKRAIALLGQTAHLEFRLVREGINPETLLLPEDVEKLPLENNSTTESTFLFLNKNIEMTGKDIADARPTFGEGNSPHVTLLLTQEGSARFERITKENIGKRLAIVLDGKVYSAPVIQDAISGGRAVITGTFSIQEAQDLAIVLRAGSLPAPVTILQENIVGPALGLETIQQGLKATLTSVILIVVFMIFYYKYSGLIASLMMLITLLFLFAELGLAGATLTLPGIAGIVLSLAMSVDANVLIYERIRDELRLGKGVKEAIDNGFNKAILAITDSNISTLLTGAILYQFGTGPIKGFAVTLSLGIISSMFTAIYLSKTCFYIWLGKPRRSLSI